MNEFWKVTLTAILAVFASSGFWAWMMSRQKKDTAEKKLLLGLAHDRIMYLGNQYLQRGTWITREEYENLNDYLYLPYHEYGGNGTAEKIMCDVRSKLTMIGDPLQVPNLINRQC